MSAQIGFGSKFRHSLRVSYSRPDHPVIFKLKTTAVVLNKKICVRTNHHMQTSKGCDVVIKPVSLRVRLAALLIPRGVPAKCNPTHPKTQTLLSRRDMFFVIPTLFISSIN